jgi:hypothetical protein
MTRRQFLIGIAALASTASLAFAQKEQKPSLVTVTLIIDGMT